MSEWISVKDRLPDEDSYVVAGANINYGPPDAAVFWFFHGGFHLHTDGLSAENYDGGACINCDFEPTHWFALPEYTKE